MTYLTLFLFGLESRNSAARHLDLYLLGDAELHGIGSRPDDRAIDSAVGNHLSPVFNSFSISATFFWRRCAGMIIRK